MTGVRQPGLRRANLAFNGKVSADWELLKRAEVFAA